MAAESSATRTESLASPPNPPAMGSSGRTLTRRGENTRRRLIQAGWQVFSEWPYSEARVIDITAAASVSTGSYYTYFDSKEELFRVIAAEALDEISRAPTRSPDNPEHDPVLDIAYASRQFFLTCFRHRTILRSIEFLQSSDGAVHLSRNGALVSTAKKVERWVQRLQTDGYCDPAIDAWYTATALMSMNVSLGYAQLVHRDDIDKIDALVDAVTPIWARAVGLDSWLKTESLPSRT